MYHTMHVYGLYESYRISESVYSLIHKHVSLFQAYPNLCYIFLVMCECVFEFLSIQLACIKIKIDVTQLGGLVHSSLKEGGLGFVN